MLRVSLVIMLGVALATRDGAADERWIVEPGPEAKDAQKLGAADVERAQKLAKDKHYAEAAAVLERVARTWPAAVHDCNLALAYLRDGALTKAQLVWDLSALRNGTRPKWCTGEVSTQLSDALHAKGYVPTTIEVEPADATVEVSGIAMRSMRTVWLPAGTVVFNASAPGRMPTSVQVTIAPPLAKASIRLEAPRPAVVVSSDAGVGAPEPQVQPDAAVPQNPFNGETPVMPDAAVTQPEPPATTTSLINFNGQPVGRRTVALVCAVTLWAGSVALGTLTYLAKTDANDHYPSDPAFTTYQDRYERLKWGTVASVSAAAVSTALYVYFRSAGDAPIPMPPSTVQVGVGPGGVGVSYGGSW